MKAVTPIVMPSTVVALRFIGKGRRVRTGVRLAGGWSENKLPEEARILGWFGCCFLKKTTLHQTDRRHNSQTTRR
jgi:hypothetical protein